MENGSHSTIGYISNGRVENGSHSTIGYYPSSLKTEWVAFFYFFMMNRRKPYGSILWITGLAFGFAGAIQGPAG